MTITSTMSQRMSNFCEILEMFSQEHSQITSMTINAFLVICENPGISVGDVVQKFDGPRQYGMPTEREQTIRYSIQLLEESHSTTEKRKRLGWIYKEPNPHNARSMMCFPTEHGWEIYNKCVFLLEG